MDVKAETVPPGVGWSELTELQLQIIEWAMKRLVALPHSREDTIRHWFVARRLVVHYQGPKSTKTPWRLLFKLDRTNLYRVVCVADPGKKTLSWWTGTVMLRSLERPEVGPLPEVEVRPNVAPVKPGATQGAN